jgi:hypothetical protein
LPLSIDFFDGILNSCMVYISMMSISIYKGE